MTLAGLPPRVMPQFECNGDCKVRHHQAPKGVGGRMFRINNLLSELGFNPDDVYSNPKTPEGRFWSAGPKLGEAREKAWLKQLA